MGCTDLEGRLAGAALYVEGEFAVFGPDPIDLTNPAPYWAVAYYGHLLIGTVALLASLVALAVRKGGPLHRKSGLLFGACLLIVCLTSIDMLREAFIAPLFMAAFTSGYAFAGGWLALQPGSRKVYLAEYSLSIFEILALLYFLSIALAAVNEGIVPPIAPAVIAAIPLILLAGDAHWYWRKADRAKLRIARHLSRMIWTFVVVLRAPLVELAAGGLPISPAVVVVGPLILAPVMVYYFRRKHVAKGLP